MEPQYMIIGQAAGTAAALANEHNQSVQDIDVTILQKNLRQDRAILEVDLEKFNEYMTPAN